MSERYASQQNHALMRSIFIALLGAFLCLNTSASELTSEETCLAKNIYYEARDQSRQAQYAVAAATLNRVLNRKFPNTVCEVVYQPNQFSWYWDGKSDNPYETEAWEESKKLARIMLQMYHNAYDNTKGALFYKKVGHPSRYFKTLEYITTIGDHEFYR